jgi:hypothetical protein
MVQFGLDSQYPRLRLLRRRPRRVGVHRRPPGLPGPALRTRCRPSPCPATAGTCGRLSRPRTTTAAPPPTQAPTVDSGPARPQPGRPAGRAAPGRFPRSCCDRLTGEVASCAPAASPRVRRRLSPWPPGRRYRPASESPAVAGVRRSPAHIHQVGAGSSLEGLYSAGSSRPPSRLACRARTVW